MKTPEEMHRQRNVKIRTYKNNPIARLVLLSDK